MVPFSPPPHDTTCVALPEWAAVQTTWLSAWVKIRFCLDFVSITFGCQKRLYLANVCLVVPIFFSLVSRKLQGRSCGDISWRRLLFPGFVPEARKAVSDVFDDFPPFKRSYRARNSVRSRSMVSVSLFLPSI